MTWYANVIYTTPAREVVESVRAYPALASRLYVVTDFKGIRSEWTRAQFADDGEIRHSLPPGGLLAIWPPAHMSQPGPTPDAELLEQPAYADNHPDSIDRDPATKWVDAGFTGTDTYGAFGSHSAEVRWPAELFETLAGMADDLGVPFAYYYCATWGGRAEAEVSWLFERGRRRLWFHDRTEGECMCREDSRQHVVPREVLQEALGGLALALPTGFFAPHERSFDWARYWLRTSR